MTAITRRAVLAGVPAVAAVVAMPTAPADAAQDPHVKWGAEHQAWHRDIQEKSDGIDRLDATRMYAGFAHLDAEINRGLDRVNELERLILETEPRTVAGLAVQMRVLECLADGFEIDSESLGRIAASAERLAGGAA